MSSGAARQARPCSGPSRLKPTCRRSWNSSTRSPTASTTAGRRDSVAEVDELERQVGDRLAHQLDRGLQVVLLRPGNPHRVALDRGAHPELGILHELHHALRPVLGDPHAHRQRPLDLVARDLLHAAGLEAAHVDVALRKARAQHVHHLVELELVVGVDGEQQLTLLDARVRALEVEAIGDFLVGLLDRVPDFLPVDLGNDVERRHYCALTPAARITSPSTAYSSRRNASNSPGDIAIGSAPSLARRSFRSALCSARCVSAFSRASTSRGVCAGARMPTPELKLPPGKPGSAMVGTSGEAGERLPGRTASASSRPSRIWPTAVVSGVQVNWVLPPIVSVSDSGEPLSGTCTASMPAAMRNFSALMCAALPMPAVA